MQVTYLQNLWMKTHYQNRHRCHSDVHSFHSYCVWLLWRVVGMLCGVCYHSLSGTRHHHSGWVHHHEAVNQYGEKTGSCIYENDPKMVQNVTC